MPCPFSIYIVFFSSLTTGAVIRVLQINLMKIVLLLNIVREKKKLFPFDLTSDIIMCFSFESHEHNTKPIIQMF